MRQIIPYIILLACLCCACTNKQDKTAETDSRTDSVGLVLRISRQSKLYTAEYRVHKIVTHDDLLRMQGSLLGVRYDKQFSLGDRKIAIPIDVTLKAYIDFSDFSDRNVERMGKFIHITLPDPKVVVTASHIDYDNIKQVTSLLRKDYTDAEKTDLTRQGVESIVRQVPDMGIIESARECASQMLIPAVSQLGYQPDHIVITFRDDLDTRRLQDIYDNENSTVKINLK